MKEDLSEQLKKVLNRGFGTQDYYVVNFKEIPDIEFYYKSNFKPSMAILELSIPADKIDKNGNLLDEEVTKYILAKQSYDENYTKAIGLNLAYKDSEDFSTIEIKDFKTEMMPIYKVHLIRDNLYAINITDTYKIFTTAELCKPLVYIYDAKNRNNSVTLHFPRGGVFTKIIPDFTRAHTWDFVANKFSILSVGGKKNSEKYLYYSAEVPNYEFNQNGWQVYGRDIEKFFNEKLDYIGFNKTEKQDFIEYWKGEFHVNTLYFVSFKFDEEIEKYVTLNFSESPKKQMRVLLEAYILNEKHKNLQFLYPNMASPSCSPAAHRACGCPRRRAARTAAPGTGARRAFAAGQRRAERRCGDRWRSGSGAG